MDKEYFILVKGSGDVGHAMSGGVLSCLRGSSNYMSYLSAEDIADHIRQDGVVLFIQLKLFLRKLPLKLKPTLIIGKISLDSLKISNLL